MNEMNFSSSDKDPTILIFSSQTGQIYPTEKQHFKKENRIIYQLKSVVEMNSLNRNTLVLSTAQ